MALSNQNNSAETVYADLCAILEKKGWKYHRHDDDLSVTFGIIGDDLPMDFVLVIDEGRQLLRVFSKLPLTVPEEKRMDMAIATCAATFRLADGSFDYDLAEGRVVYRLTASFRQSRIGEGLFQYLIRCSASIVDAYNDRFFALCKGIITLDDFLAQEK